MAPQEEAVSSCSLTAPLAPPSPSFPLLDSMRTGSHLRLLFY